MTAYTVDVVIGDPFGSLVRHKTPTLGYPSSWVNLLGRSGALFESSGAGSPLDQEAWIRDNWPSAWNTYATWANDGFQSGLYSIPSVELRISGALDGVEKEASIYVEVQYTHATYATLISEAKSALSDAISGANPEITAEDLDAALAAATCTGYWTMDACVTQPDPGSVPLEPAPAEYPLSGVSTVTVDPVGVWSGSNLPMPFQPNTFLSSTPDFTYDGSDRAWTQISGFTDGETMDFYVAPMALYSPSPDPVPPNTDNGVNYGLKYLSGVMPVFRVVATTDYTPPPVVIPGGWAVGGMAR